MSTYYEGRSGDAGTRLVTSLPANRLIIIEYASLAVDQQIVPVLQAPALLVQNVEILPGPGVYVSAAFSGKYMLLRTTVKCYYQIGPAGPPPPIAVPLTDVPLRPEDGWVTLAVQPGYAMSAVLDPNP